MKAYADLADLPEDERIRIAAHTASQGHIVGIALEADEPEKIARYERKLATYPVRVIDRLPGPVPNTILLRVGPKES